MPEYITDESLFVDQETDTDLVRQLRHQLKETGKRLHTAETRVTELETTGRKSTIAELLTAKGVKNGAKVAALIPADVEPTESGVNTWLDEYKDVFGITAEPAEGGGNSDATNQGSTVSADAQAQWAAAQAAEHSGTQNAPVGAERLFQDIRGLEGKSFDEVMAAFAKLGDTSS